jgi:hypothetical protein
MGNSLPQLPVENIAPDMVLSSGGDRREPPESEPVESRTEGLFIDTLN